MSDSVPPSEEPKDRPLSFVSAAVWTLIALFLTLLFLGITEASREGAIFDLVSRTGCQLLAYSIALFGILRVHEPETSIRHVLALRRPAVVAVLLALAIGAAIAFPLEWLDHALEAKFPPSQLEKDSLERVLSVTTVGKRIALIMSYAVLQPAFDELFFRGAIFTPLRRTRRLEGVIVATAMFETLGNFGSPRAMVTLAIATLIFAWIRGATGSIFPSMIARITYSAVVVVPLAFGHQLPRPTVIWLAGCAVAVVLCLLGLRVLARRSPAATAAEDGA